MLHVYCIAMGLLYNLLLFCAMVEGMPSLLHVPIIIPLWQLPMTIKFYLFQDFNLLKCG